jgi:hypothetical protein
MNYVQLLRVLQASMTQEKEVEFMNDMSPTALTALRVHATSASGHTAEIPYPETRAALDLMLAEAGFKAGEPVILSAHAPQSFPAAPATGDVVHVTASDIASMNAPAIPQPDGPNWIAPAQSPIEIVSTQQFWPSPNPSNVPHVRALGGVVNPEVDPGNLMSPPFPTPVGFRMSCYWQNVAAFTIQGPQKFDHAVTTTVGMSETEQTSLSAEIGVSTPHLSAKLTETVSQSVTIGTEHSVTNTYSIDPGTNQTAVWVLWQLVQVFEFIDETGQPISYDGHFVVGMKNMLFGDLSFQGRFTHPVSMMHAAQSLFSS